MRKLDQLTEKTISILAVLADRDLLVRIAHVVLHQILILAVLADRDRIPATRSSPGTGHFNPRGPCGPRRPEPGPGRRRQAISILAVLADRNPRRERANGVIPDFNPRGPCGPRRAGDPDEVRGVDISILAVLADRDTGIPKSAGKFSHFNPRGPCGPRPVTSDADKAARLAFQSSRSLRTAAYRCWRR